MKRSSLLLIGYLACLSTCSKPPQKPPIVHTVTVAQPKICDVPLFLEYPGHVDAYKTVNVQSQVAGELTGMYFEEGSVVKEGQLLFTIDSRPYVAALDKAEAALARSLATLKLAEETARRYSKLAQEEYVAKLQYDQYLTNVLQDDATAKENLAEISTAKINLGYCTMYSPMDAIAGKKEIDVGNYIEVGESTPLIVLNQINPVFGSFFAPDVDLPTIQKYQREAGELTTQVFLNQDYDHPYEGKLTLINNEVDQSTGTIFLKATLPNDNHELWPGEYIDVRVILKTIKDAVLVPNEAVQIGQQGHYVFVIKGDQTAELRNVTIGQRIGDNIVIQKGVRPGDLVVLEGQLNLSPGDKVKIEDAAAFPSVPNNSTLSDLAPEEKPFAKIRKRLMEAQKITQRNK